MCKISNAQKLCIPRGEYAWDKIPPLESKKTDLPAYPGSSEIFRVRSVTQKKIFFCENVDLQYE